MRLRMIGASLAIGWILVGGVSAQQTLPEPQRAAEQAGLNFVQQLALGDFKSAASMVSPLMTRRLTPNMLEMSWLSQGRDLGSFLDAGEAKGSDQHGQLMVDVTCRWERGSRGLSLFLDNEHRITGFHWLPPPMATPDLGSTTLPVNERIQEVEVEIGERPWTVPSILSLPRGGQARAAVVLVPDAGPLDHDGSVGVNRLYRDLAHALAEKGIAALRYEKRTRKYADRFVGTKVTVQDEIIADAELALAALRSRVEVRDLPLFLLGHGRGGTVTPAIAASDSRIAGVILLAAAARSTEEALGDEVEYSATLVNNADSENPWIAARRQVQELRTRTLDAEEVLFGVKASFWFDFCTQDGEAAVQKAAALPCRVLVLQGGRDYSVTEEDFELWKSGLAGHRDAAFLYLEDLNHHFRKGQGRSTPSESRIPKPVDPRVISGIADWCAEAANPP